MMLVVGDGNLRQSVADHVGIASTMLPSALGGCTSTIDRFRSTTT